VEEEVEGLEEAEANRVFIALNLGWGALEFVCGLLKN
jgi:hypothetical protein